MRQVVLITGARAPVALEMVRILGRDGCRVVVADSCSEMFAAGSRYVYASYRVPEARKEGRAFVAALANVVKEEKVDLLIPTCEEIFTIARWVELFPKTCRVLADTFETLEALHRKDRFCELASRLGLRVPFTVALEEGDRQIDANDEAVVVKPVYSRFGNETRVIRRRELGRVAEALSGEDREWVAQQFVKGRLVCAYAVAEKGELRAYVSYGAMVSQHAVGPSLAFEVLDCLAVREWVERFVESVRFSGQIAFDFIVDDAGEAWGIECNPRATSGLHLLSGVAGMSEVLLGLGGETCVEAEVGLAKGLVLPSLLFGKGAKARFADVIYAKDDWFPCIGQLGTLAGFVCRSVWRGIRLSEAMVDDIRWNGEGR